MDASPLPSRGPQSKGDKIRSGYLTPAFLEAQKRAKMLHKPCILGDHQSKGDKIRIGCLTPAFLEAQKRAEMLRHPCILRDPQTKGDKISGRLTPAFLGVPKQSGSKSVAASLLPSRGPQSKGDKIRSGYLTPAFLETQKRAEMVHHPCILGDPQTKGDKISGCLTPASSGAQKRAEMLCHPCILGGSPTPSAGTESEVAHRWAHRLQACIFSKLGNFFVAVRSCHFSSIFAVNACRKKLSHHVNFFAVSYVILSVRLKTKSGILKQKIPGIPTGAVGCRIQDPRTRGYRW